MIFVEARRKVGKNDGWRRGFVVFDLASGRRDRAGGNLNGKLLHRARDKCIFGCKRRWSVIEVTISSLGGRDEFQRLAEVRWHRCVAEREVKVVTNGQ